MISSTLKLEDDEGKIFVPVSKSHPMLINKERSFLPLMSPRFTTKLYFHHSAKIKILKAKKAEFEKKEKEERLKEELENKKASQQ